MTCATLLQNTQPASLIPGKTLLLGCVYTYMYGWMDGWMDVLLCQYNYIYTCISISVTAEPPHTDGVELREAIPDSGPQPPPLPSLPCCQPLCQSDRLAPSSLTPHHHQTSCLLTPFTLTHSMVSLWFAISISPATPARLVDQHHLPFSSLPFLFASNFVACTYSTLTSLFLSSPVSVTQCFSTPYHRYQELKQYSNIYPYRIIPVHFKTNKNYMNYSFSFAGVDTKMWIVYRSALENFTQTQTLNT